MNRKAMLASLASVLAGSGLVWSQPPADQLPPAVPAAPQAPRLAEPVPIEPERPASSNKTWAGAEYLLWRVKNGPQPLPLAISGSPATLFLPAAPTVYGPSTFDFGTFSGGRVTAGTWVDSDQTFGIEARGFLLEQRSVRAFNYQGTGPTSASIAVPFFDTFTGLESSLAENTGTRTGSVVINATSQLWGAEANTLIQLTGPASTWSAGLLAGFRYVDLAESETIQLSRTSTLGVPFLGTVVGTPGAAINSLDSFSARNQFYGGQIGTRLTGNFSRFYTQVDAKIALGATHQNLLVGGSSSLTVPGAATSYANGGLFAGPSNIGQFTNNQFSVIPEVDVRVGLNLSNQIKIFVGYDFFYWTNVARPGNQVNRNVNTQEIATSFNYNAAAIVPARAPVLQTSDFWAQGVNFGFEFRY